MGPTRSAGRCCSGYMTNPFDSEMARENSAYGSFENGPLVRVGDVKHSLSGFEEKVHAEFRARLLDVRFSCVAARAAVNSGMYRLGVYGDMTDGGTLAGLARDLFTFTQEQPTLGSDFTTFAASFAGPIITSEAEFERQLWAVLQTLYDVDRLYNPPDPKVAEDPEAGDFGFSFAGRGFFVIGLHPAFSRLARQFLWPTLVFNSHAQFDRLKADGRYFKMQKEIGRVRWPGRGA